LRSSLPCRLADRGLEQRDEKPFLALDVGTQQRLQREEVTAQLDGLVAAWLATEQLPVSLELPSDLEPLVRRSPRLEVLITRTQGSVVTESSHTDAGILVAIGHGLR
jgi:hypothetical protein